MPDPQKTDPTAVPPAAPQPTETKPSLIGLEQDGIHVNTGTAKVPDAWTGTDETREG